MTRRDWWLGVVAIGLAILLHAAFPRYEWRHSTGSTFVRIDRWTGRANIGSFFDERGWVTLSQRRAEQQPVYLDDNGNPIRKQ